MVDSNEKEKIQEQDVKLSRLQRFLVITCLVLLIAILCIKVMEVFTDLIHILAVSVFVTYSVVGLVNYLDKLLKKPYAFAVFECVFIRCCGHCRWLFIGYSNYRHSVCSVI